MSVTKQYLKSRPVSKVTFRLPSEAAPEAEKVFLVGEFNNWDPQATPMTRLKNGDFKVVLDLEPGHEYAYRYLIEGQVWENDWSADKYDPCAFAGGENSVVVV